MARSEMLSHFAKTGAFPPKPSLAKGSKGSKGGVPFENTSTLIGEVSL